MPVLTSTMNDQGRVVIPSPIRRAMGITGPTELLFRYEDGRLVVETIESAVVEVQKVAASYVTPGRSLVDELIEERRTEASSE